jgi:hypothetical protein
MPDCQGIADEIAELKAERSTLQADLHGLPHEPRPSPSQKAAIVQQIKALSSQITKKEAELRHCLGLPEPLPSVTCPMSGATSTMVTSSSAFSGTTVLAISPTFVFLSPDHRSVDMAAASTTLGPISIPGTPCTDTVTIVIQATRGTFDVATGELTLGITATISHSLAGGFLNWCSTQKPDPSLVMSPLTTGSLPSGISGTISGAPLNRTTGEITLVAAGTLAGGDARLAGTGVDLRITGTLSCLPLP